MKKVKSILVFSMLSALFAGFAFALDFNPTVMTIEGNSKIFYSFNSNELSIPVTLTGTPASIWLVINTKDQAANISNIRNGYLGWHWVNKIDTTVYISSRFQKNPGNSEIIWDGKDENGNVVLSGDYNYYLWAYDDKTPRQVACQFMQVGFDWDSQMTTIVEKGTDGNPLANPFLFGSVPWYTRVADTTAANYSWKAHGTIKKWTLGSDPTDVSLLQTTRMTIFDDYVTDHTNGGPTLDPQDYNTFYCVDRNFTQKVSTINKWGFVPGGAAVMGTDWGGWDNVTLEDHGVAIGNWSQQPSLFTDNNYIYQVSPGLHQKIEEWNKLRVYNFENGHVVVDKMMHEWYMPDDRNPHAYINGAFHHMYSRTPYQWFLLSHTSCMHEMINTSRLVVDQDDETDMIMFQNSNGDYFLDSAYNSGVEPSWHCLADNKETSMRRDSIAIDRNGFNVIGVSYLGLSSFGVSTQDGTGIGMMQFADDTISDDKNLKGGGLLIDNGGSFDGLYYCSPLMPDGTGGWAGATAQQAWYVAFDSFHGIITSKPEGPYVAIITPHIGERLLPGTNFEIKWESFSSVLKVKIEFSINNGSAWTTIVENTDSDGSYTWNVPEVISSNCLIKISDAADPGVSDTSHGAFAIGNIITVLSPNGGEKLSVNGSKDIKWTNEGVNNVKIEYSPDNGTSWIIVVESTPSDGTYTWLLPGTETTTGLIKITDTANGNVSDISNSVFSILQTSIKVISPNGGEEWETKQTYQIKWSSFNITKVKIELSIDNGTTWSTLASDIAASLGTYSWKATGNPSSRCLVKISDSGGSSTSDISDGSFTMIPSTSLWTVYNTSDGIAGNDLWTVAADKKGGVWIGSSGSGVSYFNGLSWITYKSIPSTDVYTIAVDNDSTVWFGPTWVQGLFKYDDVSWRSIVGSPSLIRDIVIDKNNVKWIGTWTSGLYKYDGSIWTHYSPSASGLKAEHPEILGIDYDNTLWVGYKHSAGLSHFDGSSWTHYTSSSGLASDQVRGIAFGSDGKKWFGTSNGISSFDGTKWTTYRNTSGLVSNDVYAIAVDLENTVWVGTTGGVSSFDGANWKSYTTSNSELPNNYIWKIAVDTNNVKFFATKGGGVASFSYHSGPYVLVTAPNGSEIWQTGSSHEITWISKDVEKIDIQYSSDNGVTWNLIAGSVDATLKIYPWTLPETGSQQYKIRLSNSSDSAVKDESNGVFTVSDPFVRLIYPNGGESLAIGSQQNIRWFSIGIDKVRIDYSVDGGLNWFGLTDMEASAGSILWPVVNYESGHCIMRIRDASIPERVDVTDSEFTIIRSNIKLSFPVGGEEWGINSYNVIRWSSVGVEKVRIDYSVDDGKSWNLIENNINAVASSYGWETPDVLSRLCRIRVSEDERPELNNMSGTFAIVRGTVDVSTGLPKEFTVFQNTPNPFNPSTTISFALPKSDKVKVDIYNLSGQKVASLADNYMNAGRYSLTWNASGFSGGIYIYRVSYGSVTKTMKMAFVK